MRSDNYYHLIDIITEEINEHIKLSSNKKNISLYFDDFRYFMLNSYEMLNLCEEGLKEKYPTSIIYSGVDPINHSKYIRITIK